jgi:hypothetical protein
MLVFEVICPGTRLDYEDKDWAWNVQNLLGSLESQFFQANLALNFFLNVVSTRSSFADAEIWKQASERRAEIQRALEQERGCATRQIWDEVYFEADVCFKREKWSNGRPPREFEHQLPFIYARAFLYALDAFEKFLRVLAKEPKIPEQVAQFHKQMLEEFPDLREVRNSIQHLEDRSRGLGNGRKPLDLKPVVNSFINAPAGGVLALSNLNGSRYGSTMADGHYGEVDVSQDSLAQLQKILEGVLHSFNWCGPKRHAPSA